MLSLQHASLLLVLAVVAVSGSSVCQPGAVWRQDDITVCKCAPGGRPVCDTQLSARQYQRRADAVQDEHADCRAGQTWMQECSRCQCVADGLWFCEFRGCGATPDGAVNETPSYVDVMKPMPYQGDEGEGKPVPYEGDGCTPGDTYMRECNQCWCNDKGIEACTMMGCIDGSGDGGN